MTWNCRDVETQLAPFVDGELPAADAASVSAHLVDCPECRATEAAERFGKRVLTERASYLTTPAPAALRAAVRRAMPARSRWSLGRAALAAAASLVAVVVLVGVGGLVKPVPVFAAQVALDHLKCARLGPNAASSDPRALEASWLTWQGWSLRVPSGQPAGLRLLGYRRCLVTEGKAAHIFYERAGHIISLFVLPDGLDFKRAELEMFGQDAVLWTSHGHTYALVGAGTRGALTAAAAAMEQELE